LSPKWLSLLLITYVCISEGHVSCELNYTVANDKLYFENTELEEIYVKFVFVKHITVMLI